MPGIASMPEFWPVIITFVGPAFLLYYLYRAPKWKVRVAAVVFGGLLAFASGLYQCRSINIWSGEEMVFLGFPFPWFIITAGIYYYLSWLSLIADFLIYSFLVLGVLGLREITSSIGKSETFSALRRKK